MRLVDEELEDGLTAYRDAIGARRDAAVFAVRHARERLAIPDRDADALVRLYGSDLSSRISSFPLPRRCASSGSTTRGWRGRDTTPRRPEPCERPAYQCD